MGEKAEVGIQDGAQAFGVLHWNDDTRGAAGLGERHTVWAG